MRERGRALLATRLHLYLRRLRREGVYNSYVYSSRENSSGATRLYAASPLDFVLPSDAKGDEQPHPCGTHNKFLRGGKKVLYRGGS